MEKRRHSISGYRILSRLGSVLSVLGLMGSWGCLERPLATPEVRTTNVFVDDVPTRSVDKIDLLFVVDNSKSMADKQRMLELAVPGFLERLVNPSCVSRDGTQTIVPAQPSGAPCAGGFDREFEPIEDIHVGIISSSLGGPKGTLCDQPSLNDHGHLIPTVRSDVSSYENRGFWAWDPKGKENPPGEASLSKLVADFSKGLSSVGEDGCGYEAPLEAWYRFLVDPEPYQALEVEAGQIKKIGLDEELLQQREAFLRPDSLVAIVMLTDENDCSASDQGTGWLLGASSFTLNGQPASKLPPGTSACSSDPNGVCCRSCVLSGETPPGCQPVAEDPACRAPANDPPNLRCFDQKRRFGLDLLQPIERYTRGLAAEKVPNRAGQLVPNPLFSDLTGSGHPARSPRLVFLAGIVGVPWQDAASDESLSKPNLLEYLSATELKAQGLWANMVGDTTRSGKPLDPLLQESVEPRVGTHPRTSEMLASADSQSPSANLINGHEYHSDGTDLQYACVFPLPEGQRECAMSASGTCDCGEAPSGPLTSESVLQSVRQLNRSLCQPPGGGPAGTVQFQAKAYPGNRLLKVLHATGENAVVASICPKITTGPTTLSSFGYNPALAAIVESLGDKLQRQCLPRKVELETTGQLPCRVVESSAPSEKGTCACGPGRHLLDAQATPQSLNLANAVKRRLVDTKKCGTSNTPKCEGLCLCEIEETSDPRCRSEVHAPQGISGFCYVDPSRGLGNPELVSKCPKNSQQSLRFLGDDLPRNGSNVFYACAGGRDVGQAGP